MKSKIKKFFSCCLFPLLFTTTYGAPPSWQEEGKLLSFANFLYFNGEYYRAISEYKRFEFLYPDSTYLTYSQLQIGRSYMAGLEFKNAIEYWKNKKLEFKSLDYYKLKRLEGIAKLDLNAGKVFTLRETYIKEAISDLREANSGLDNPGSIPDFINDWENKDPLPEKSPWVAGGMSAIIPGSGSAYVGRYREGIYSFFITSLFYLATRDAMRKDQKELSYLFGFFTTAFYGGGIYTASSSAHKYNDRQKSDYLYELRKKHGIWFIPKVHNQPGQF